MKDKDFVKQRDAMQCGVAALTMVCRHFGARYSLDFVSKFCHATTDGVSLKGISDAAERLGLETCGARVSPSQLAAAPLPAILHWNQNHFVVLHKVSRSGRRFHIADPGKGLYSLSESEFRQHWISTSRDGKEMGVALFLEPTEKFGEMEDDVWSGEEQRSFRFLFGYVKQYRKYFLQITLGLLLACILQLILPFLTQSIVDVGIRHENVGFIWLILLGELMIVAGRTATDFIRRWLLLHISMRINISLLSDFFIKLLKLPMSFFDTKLTGDLLQRMGDHNRVQSFLTSQLLNVVFTVFSFLIFGVVLFIYDGLIFLIFLLGSVAYGAWIATFLRRRKVIDYELFEQQAINQNRTFQFITSMQEIKLQDCERRRRWEWEDCQADLFAVQMKSLRLQQTQEAGSIFINEVKNILITVFAATAVIHGEITLGAMLAIQYIVGQLNSPVAQLMQFVFSLQDVKISLERINEIHGGRNEEPERERLTDFPAGEPRGIAFRNVSFRYDPHALRKTIDGVSIGIPEGKVTAIVGASGSGKTTLLKLMLGYYPLEEGAVEVAGKPLSDYNMKWWRRHCGVVMQDGVIFSESIARNIAVDDNEIDPERLERAARIACIHDYVMSLPLRYDTKVGKDGRGLSQGQRQRILIARAVYRNPDFIFLDEATNSLDAKNERVIVENLADFYKGKTVVVVAHRLSTVSNADNIIVLDDGKVVETGTHDELTAKRGAYYNLVRNQLELGS
ncbi:MAG: peptidase domain-containing ABC transporter [Muribaculaceae bacterium]|nr:peptidase domain-containing ABC transporter [Muribaculaceae bacterium]